MQVVEPKHLYDFPVHHYYTVFRSSIKSAATKQAWTNYLHNYMTYHKMKGYPDLMGPKKGKKDQTGKAIQEKIVEYITWKQESQGVKSQTLRNHLSALHHFYWINEIDGIKWDRVRAFLKEPQKVADDKAYTHEQVAQALKFADYRTKVIILMQSSSAIRIGAICDNHDRKRHMRVGDLTYIERHGIYSIKVYPGTPAEYITFTTPECASTIKDYLNYRASKGEVIGPNSPLIREQFNAEETSSKKPRTTDPTKPVPAPQKTLLNIMRRIFLNAGLREIEKGKKWNRKENMLTHGLRKFAKRNMRKAGMDPLIIEYLMGHQSGDLKMGVTKLMMTYDPAEDGELLTEYMKAIPNLTISSVEREKFAREQAEKERDLVNEKYEKELMAQKQELESHKETIKMLVEAQKEREELEKHKGLIEGDKA